MSDVNLFEMEVLLKYMGPKVANGAISMFNIFQMNSRCYKFFLKNIRFLCELFFRMCNIFLDVRFF